MHSQYARSPETEGTSRQTKTLGDIEVRGHHGFLIVGIRHADGTTVLNPAPSTPLVADDVVIVLGHDDDIPQLAKRFSMGTTKIMYRGVAGDV